MTILLVVAAFAVAQFWQARGVPNGAAPDFSLPLLPNKAAEAAGGDGSISLRGWRDLHPGKAVAIYIWADWCPVCKLTAPSVTDVARDWPVLTVASQSQVMAQLAHTMQQRGLDWVTGVDPKGEVGRLYGVRAVPVWIVVAPDNQISSVSVGYTTELGMRWRLWWAQRA